MAAAVSTSPASEKNDGALVGARREDRRDLVAGDEPDDVEVVDRAVPEQPAARRDVGRVRWRLVVGAGPDGVDEPELAVGHRLARPLVAAVEPALEPDVHRDVGTRRPAWPAPSVSSRVEATGFSQNVGTPASTPRRSSGAWPGVAVAMTKASTPEASSASGVSAKPTPSWSATLRAASGSRSVTTSSSTKSSPVSVSAWKAPIRPTPASPMRIPTPSCSTTDAVRPIVLPVRTNVKQMSGHYDVVPDMARDAGARDLRACLENLNTAVDHPGTPFARAEDTLALVAAVDHPHLRLMLDLYHAQIGEGNLIELARRCLPYVGEIQVADVPGRCEPGTGEIFYPAVARALHDAGYAGTVGLEAFASGDSETALGRFRTAFTV